MTIRRARFKNNERSTCVHFSSNKGNTRFQPCGLTWEVIQNPNAFIDCSIENYAGEVENSDFRFSS